MSPVFGSSENIKELKFLRCVHGKTMHSDEDFIRELNEKTVRLKEVFNVEECDVILAFCSVASRAGTDIKAALQKLQALSDSKPAVLVVLHQTFDPELIAPDSSRSVTRDKTMTVDCLFQENEGLLKSHKNQEVLDKVTVWMKEETTTDESFASLCGFSTFCSRSGSTSSDRKKTAKEEVKCKDLKEEVKELELQLLEKQKIIDMKDELLQKIVDILTPVIKEEQRNLNGAYFKQSLSALLRKIEEHLENVTRGKDSEKDGQGACSHQEEVSSEDPPEPQLVVLERASSVKSIRNTIGIKDMAAGTSAVVQEHQTLLDLSSGHSQEKIRHFVCLSAPEPHTFFIVVPLKQSTGEERGMVKKMEEIFEEKCWRKSMVLFTVTDEEQEKSIEEFVQSGNQEVERLIEKCGNRFHCLNIKESGAGSQISELLEKIEKTMEENEGDNFYSSNVYQPIKETKKTVQDAELQKKRGDTEYHGKERTNNSETRSLSKPTIKKTDNVEHEMCERDETNESSSRIEEMDEGRVNSTEPGGVKSSQKTQELQSNASGIQSSQTSTNRNKESTLKCSML